MKLKLAAGATLLLACGGGTGQGSTSPGDGSKPADTSSGESSDVSGGEMEVAGGETSEFSGGDIAACPQIDSNEPLDLARADWAPWVALVEGRHESTLGWRRLFEVDTVTGFEEHTSVVLDVSVIGGRALVYGGDGSGYESDWGCDGQRAEQLGLAIEFATADGAVVGTYREWFERHPDDDAPGGEVLARGRLHPDANSGGGELTGGLVMAISPAVDGEPFLYPGYFTFSPDGVRGALASGLRLSETRGVTLIEGVFPDDPCRGSGRPIALDANVDFISPTPRQLFQRAARRWTAAPVPATWSAPDGSSPGALPPTEVRLSAGEPTHACVSGSYIQVHAPLTLATADGRVNVTHSFATSVADQGGAMTDGQSAWLPASRFETQMGISGVNFDGAEYGSIFLSNSASYTNRDFSGSLDVALWRPLDDESTGYPRLTWCAGDNCR